MRKVSKRRARRNAEVQPARDEYRHLYPWCQWCVKAAALDLHEIARGNCRSVAIGERCCWLHLCRPCHEMVGQWSIAKQLALKFLVDTAHYDRRRVLEIMGLAPTAVTIAEVETQVAHLWGSYDRARTT